MNYEEYARIAKALSDPKRVKILDIVSCEEMCACDILEHFDFTQPTLSYHMKILVDAGLIVTDKRGTWTHYSVNQEVTDQYIQGTVHLLTHSTECICKKEPGKEETSSLPSVVLG